MEPDPNKTARNLITAEIRILAKEARKLVEEDGEWPHWEAEDRAVAQRAAAMQEAINHLAGAVLLLVARDD